MIIDKGILIVCELIAYHTAQGTPIPTRYKAHISDLKEKGYLDDDNTLGSEYWALREAIVNEHLNTNHNGA